ncbi:hypothetical protein TL18_08575 [Methanobrevibacter sp. YE315]|nr:hypothetical protein TL18_08575 [Methanobrevibacter sp. YE315]
MDFKDNIQIIVVNDASQDATSDVVQIYQEKYPQNIILINNETNQGAAGSRNIGLSKVQGEYVNFLDSDDTLSKNTFKTLYDFLTEHDDVDIASIPIYFFGDKSGGHVLNYKYEETQVIDLLENPDYIQLSGASSFFRASKIKNHKFDDILEISEDPLFINQILLKNPKLGVISGCKYNYRKNNVKTSLVSSSIYRKSYFTSRMDNYFLRIIKDSLELYDEVPKFIQHLVAYDMYWMFNIKSIDDLLSEEEFNILFDKLIEILSYVDDDVIYNMRFGLDLLKTHMLMVKHYKWDYLNKNFSNFVIGDSLRDEILEHFALNQIRIDFFEFRSENEIYISGIYKTFFHTETDIFAVLDDKEEIPVSEVEFPQRDSVSLNRTYAHNHSFEVTIPVANRISFKTNETDLTIGFNRTSRISHISRYKLSKDYLAIDCEDHIQVINKTTGAVLKNEFATLKSMWNHKWRGWRTAIPLRILYFLAYPFFKNKRIWIFGDLPRSADDNGLKLFKYVIDNDDSDVKKYFVVQKTDEEYNYLSDFGKIKRLLGFGKAVPEYEKVEKIGPVIPYASLKHRLYSLYAELIITSHPDNFIIYPFWGNFTHLAGFVRSKTVFLQHGVTLHDVSHWLNRFDKHLEMLVTVSRKERESFFNGNYGYSEDVVKLCGFPRFDYLERLEDKKEIVIMPTWRRKYNAVSESEFMESELFENFNSLLNDESLINFLDSKGYKLAFKPHPNLKKFIDTFTKHPLVEFTDKSYADIFNHSSMLITDFSSVAFDFAYLKKPLIYYHYDIDEFHFDLDKAYFKYDTMGFGPITVTPDELKSKIMDLVNKDCEMDDLYKARVDDFFEYTDRNNCKRTLDEIKKIDNYY